jgi:serine/threonine protein phosphatase 1
MPRTIAIGDVHGYSAALDGILAIIEPKADDTIVLLGDYVDRGPDSRGTIDRVIDLRARCQLVPLMGNHDHLFVEVCVGRGDLLPDWLAFGGAQTVASYGRVPEDVPEAHLEFLRACPRLFEQQHCFFVHANYDARAPLTEQPAALLLWQSLRNRLPGPHMSGKTAIVGHTAQKTGEVFDLGYLKCIDTFCYGGGWLTALDVDSGQLWQVDQTGRPRQR